MTSEQLEYVKGELAKGVAPEAVKQTLRTSGYTEQLIGEIFNAVTAGVPSAGVVAQPAVVQKSGPSVLKIVLIVVGVIVAILFFIFIAIAVTVSSSLKGAQEKGRDAASKSMVHNFRAQAELHYDGNDFSYEGACLELSAPGADCQDGPDAYRAYIELTDGSLYCIDSTGSASVISKEPPLTACK